ncbi:MAG: STAS domain-containing protein [Nocardioidaceae bacterium]
MDEEIAFMARAEGRQPTVVRLIGELDLVGVPQVRSVLAGLDGDVELDCSGLDFIDAAGLRVIQEAHECCAVRGSKLVLVDPSPVVEHVLGIVELDTVLLIQRNGEVS